MPTMNISLTKEVASFVEQEMRSGRYASASELVRESLRLLERERDLETERARLLKFAVQAGLDDMREGRLSDLSIAEIAASVLAETKN